MYPNPIIYIYPFIQAKELHVVEIFITKENIFLSPKAGLEGIILIYSSHKQWPSIYCVQDSTINLNLTIYIRLRMSHKLI